MNKLIAICGLDCETCDARKATLIDDDALRAQVAALWSELNGAAISPDMINCVGCRVEGVKTPFCDELCPMKRCAEARGVETCGHCAELQTCEIVSVITGSNPDALARLLDISVDIAQGLIRR